MFCSVFLSVFKSHCNINEFFFHSYIYKAQNIFHTCSYLYAYPSKFSYTKKRLLEYTPRCLKILGNEIGRDKDALGFTKGPPMMKNQQKFKSCLDKIQGFSKKILDFSDFWKFFIEYKMSGIESYMEKVPKLLKSDECRGT